MELRGHFPSILMFYLVVKIHITMVSELPFFGVFSRGKVFLSVPKQSQPHRGFILLTQLFQPVRIQVIAFLISDEKFIKAVAKLQ